MEDTSLAMQHNPKLELKSHASHNHHFLNLCEDIEIVKRGFKIRQPIFVFQHRDHDLILGQPFLNSVN